MIDIVFSISQGYLESVVAKTIMQPGNRELISSITHMIITRVDHPS